jgi:hypothetical protein
MASERGHREGTTQIDGPAAAASCKLRDRGEEGRLSQATQVRLAGDARGEERADDDEEADKANGAGHHDAEDERSLAEAAGRLRLQLRRVE